MTMESALEAQGEGYAGAPTGFRRLTPSLLRVDRTAESFAGLPDGVTMHGQLLAAFKAAAPQLGLSPRLVHAVDWLFRFTQPQDWGRGGRPIVWPSASMQQEALGLSESRVKVLNRALIEAGLITMKDSPNGKRYGRRDPKGKIVEAYGFDLSPIAARHAEFVQLAEEARAERAEMGRLRRRATIARNGITQILETAAEYGFQGEEWMSLARDCRNLARRSGRWSGPRRWRWVSRAWSGGSARRGNAWKRCSSVRRKRFPKLWIQAPWGLKTGPTNIPTNQVLILRIQ